MQPYFRDKTTTYQKRSYRRSDSYIRPHLNKTSSCQSLLNKTTNLLAGNTQFLFCLFIFQIEYYRNLTNRHIFVEIQTIYRTLTLCKLSNPSLQNLIHFTSRKDRLHPFRRTVYPTAFPNKMLILLMLLSATPIINDLVPCHHIDQTRQSYR